MGKVLGHSGRLEGDRGGSATAVGCGEEGGDGNNAPWTWCDQIVILRFTLVRVINSESGINKS